MGSIDNVQFINLSICRSNLRVDVSIDLSSFMYLYLIYMSVYPLIYLAASVNLIYVSVYPLISLATSVNVSFYISIYLSIELCI